MIDLKIFLIRYFISDHWKTYTQVLLRCNAVWRYQAKSYKGSDTVKRICGNF